MVWKRPRRPFAGGVVGELEVPGPEPRAFTRAGIDLAGVGDLERDLQRVAVHLERLLDVVAALNALFVYDLTQLLHGVRRDRRAEVCHDQALLQLVVEILVDGLPDDAVVPRLFDPCKNTHRLTP